MCVKTFIIDVKEVMIKILLHLRVVEFLVKGLVSFMYEGVGMIVIHLVLVSEISYN